MNELLLLSASRLANMIRTRQVSASDVVRAHIERAESVNPRLNALVHQRFEAALSEARNCDKRIMKLDRADVPRFFGVPFTVKETLHLKGAPHTLGTFHKQGQRANTDATTVRRMREAGAIPIGSTNIPEWAYWFECENLIYGRTKNPYDPSRTPGGSSGGEAAIISSGASPMGLGSDVGGSIRMPAAFCGIFGHKPTNRLIPLTGQYPLYPDVAAAYAGNRYPYTTQGPLARRAEDLWPLLKIMMGEDGIDPETGKTGFIDKIRARSKSGFDRPESFWRGKRVFIMPSPEMFLVAKTERQLSDAVKSAAEVFADLGANIDEFEASAFKSAFEVWSGCMNAVEGPRLNVTLGGGERPPDLFSEFIALARRKPRYTLPTLMICAMQKISPRGDRVHKLTDVRRRYLEHLEARLGDDGILILPAHPRVAPKHGTTLLRPLDFAMTAVFNVMETPVTVAPVGQNSTGLPLSVQIVAARGNDHLTIGAALALENAGRTWQPPLEPNKKYVQS